MEVARQREGEWRHHGRGSFVPLLSFYYFSFHPHQTASSLSRHSHATSPLFPPFVFFAKVADHAISGHNNRRTTHDST